MESQSEHQALHVTHTICPIFEVPELGLSLYTEGMIKTPALRHPPEGLVRQQEQGVHRVTQVTLSLVDAVAFSCHMHPSA